MIMVIDCKEEGILKWIDGGFVIDGDGAGNQHVPQHASLQRNDGVVVQPASSLNHSQMRRWDRAPPIDRQQMARMSRVIEGSNSTFVDSNRTFVDCTQQVPNQLGVPISSNADEAVNTTEEHNELDLNLRL
ncbi:hypothetical protein FXO38_06412 [Capsicum annuum]|nr:hypothetical protein FXO37_25435 [Capsicum annuum]KAF3671819.1 hypothetical protein FXO38_06412 [Capsicum annuum]